jgi:hypothetical protein
MRTRTIWQAAPLAGLLALVLTGRAPAQEEVPSVDEIVARSNRVSYYQGEDGRAQVTMIIHDPQGRTRRRRFTILRRDERPPQEEADQYGQDEYTGDQKFYVYFHLPADVEDTVFMVWKHVALETDDDRWLYLPALDLVKRISAAQERTSFVGSHFFYEDVSGRNPSEDEHELTETTDNYFVLRNTPKKPELVEFAHYKMWVHRQTYIPVRVVYYDEQDKAYRRYDVRKVETIQDYPTVTESRMTNLRTEGYTDITYRQVEYDVGLPEDIFTKRYLRRPPVQHLQ